MFLAKATALEVISILLKLGSWFVHYIMYYTDKNQKPWPRGYKMFFMLKSAEHEIFSANKYENAKIVGIFIFICREIFMLSYI